MSSNIWILTRFHGRSSSLNKYHHHSIARSIPAFKSKRFSVKPNVSFCTKLYSYCCHQRTCLRNLYTQGLKYLKYKTPHSNGFNSQVIIKYNPLAGIDLNVLNPQKIIGGDAKELGYYNVRYKEERTIHRIMLQIAKVVRCELPYKNLIMTNIRYSINRKIK